jgi:hypothetical protein
VNKVNFLNRGSLILIAGLLIITVSFFAYFKTTSTTSSTLITTISLNTASKTVQTSNDTIFIEKNEKNGEPFEIKKKLSNKGNNDINKIKIKLSFVEKTGDGEIESLIVRNILFGDNFTTEKKLVELGFDANQDKVVSLYELSMKSLDLGALPKGENEDLYIQGEFLKGLVPFNSDSEEANISVDIEYFVE